MILIISSSVWKVSHSFLIDSEIKKADKIAEFFMRIEEQTTVVIERFASMCSIFGYINEYKRCGL